MSQDTALFYALRHPNPSRRREAIVGVAKQGQFAALPILIELAEADDAPELRVLALKAVRHLQKQQTLQLIDPLSFDAAHEILVEAKQLYQQRGAEAAFPTAEKALKLDPTLADDATIKQIMAAVEKQQPVEDSHQPDEHSWRGWQPVRRRSPFQWMVVAVLAGLTLLLFFRTGVFDSYIGSIQTQQWRENLRREGDIDYYLFMPEGNPPPSGWGVLVVLHDYSYSAESLLPLFVELARIEALILVAPTFGDYPQPFANETTARLDAILIQVRNEFQTDEAGAVLFGYGIGGEIAMLYARDYFQVGAVAAYGAPNLYQPPADDPILPYLLVYGEYDSQREVLREQFSNFESYANPTEMLVIPNIGKELGSDAALLAVELARQLYAVR